MTDITPPPELVSKWCYEDGEEIKSSPRWFFSVCAKAAQWGSDQELEACCALIEEKGFLPSSMLRLYRRPKPPSAIGQAEALIERYEDGWCPSPAQWHVIREGLAEGRRALEQLDD
jgi:hypothetical protein